MPEIISRKVPVGVSACVAGCPVRYNGRGFESLATMGRERQDFSFTPVCPECMAGLGVPRDPIHLTGTGQAVRAGEAKVKSRRGRDVTAELIAGSTACLDALQRAGVRVMIFKESSPSCGVRKARVGKRREESSEGSGVFGAMLLETGWFLIPDTALANPLAWWDWRRRMHAWLWLSDRAMEGAADLYESWHVVKFIIQETDRPFADAMGRHLAEMPRKPEYSQLVQLRESMLDALRTPSTRSRIAGWMLKSYRFHAKRGTLDGVDLHDLKVDSPEFRANVMSLADELIKLERISFENDLLFATSPVIHRDGRRVKAREERVAE